MDKTLREKLKEIESLTQDKSSTLEASISDITEGISIITDVLFDMPKSVDTKLDTVKKEVESKISSLELKHGKDGKDGKNGKDGIDGVDGKDGKDGSPDTAGEIADKLETLKGDDRLSAKAIKGLEDYVVRSELIDFGRGSNVVINRGSSGGAASTITGNPTEVMYFDLNGKGYSDPLFYRDDITNVSYLGYRTGAGQFTNALKLGNFIGGFITDGVGFERHDAVGDNFTFSAAMDGTPVGNTTNSLLQGYVDFTNGIYTTGTYNANEAAFDYSNQSIGVGGTVSINDTDAYMVYGDGSTFQSYLSLDQNGAGFQYEDLGSGRKMENKVDQTRAIAGNFDGSGNSMSWQLDDFNRYFNVFGLYNAVTDTYGDMLKLDASTGIMGFGDVLKIDSNIGIFANNSNGTAYVNGFRIIRPGWTPTFLSDGFTGTGLNDMSYDSTLTYNGPYPNTYNATIATVNSVYMQLVSISTPGFNIGDTVTDGSGSTATVIAGGDVDGFIVVQPIVDTGWTSATAITDISSGAAATVYGVIYTDTFSWTATVGGGSVLVPCNSYVALNNGLTVGFGSPTGHTVGDTWTWDMFKNYSYSKIALFDGASNQVKLGDVDGNSNRTVFYLDDRTKLIKFIADGITTQSRDIPITRKIVLTQAELSTMGTVPIVVAPAPGVGKAIQPISAYAEYEYGGVAYANFGNPGLTHNPSSGSLPLKTSVSLLDQTANYVRFLKQTDEGYNAGFTIDNQPLYFTDDDGSDPTAGNGTLTLYVTYKIIKL